MRVLDEFIDTLLTATGEADAVGELEALPNSTSPDTLTISTRPDTIITTACTVTTQPTLTLSGDTSDTENDTAYGAVAALPTTLDICFPSTKYVTFAILSPTLFDTTDTEAVNVSNVFNSACPGS